MTNVLIAGGQGLAAGFALAVRIEPAHDGAATGGQRRVILPEFPKGEGVFRRRPLAKGFLPAGVMALDQLMYEQLGKRIDGRLFKEGSGCDLDRRGEQVRRVDDK